MLHRSDTVKFTISAEMKPRWIPHFMSMLKCMEMYGSLGCSREVAIYADGDGDFQPKFKSSIKFETVEPVRDNNGDRLYDAG